MAAATRLEDSGVIVPRASSCGATALVLSSHLDLRGTWCRELERRHWQVKVAPLDEALRASVAFDATLCVFSVDDALTEFDFDLAARVRRDRPGMATWLSPRCGSEALAIRAFRSGFLDYVPVPRIDRDLDDALARLEARPTTRLISRIAPSSVDHVELVGSSPELQSVRERIDWIARADSNVLVTGETGTGKELVAESIQRLGPRRAAPFVRVNCAAVPEALFESILFGHERGAFTGAVARHDGALLEGRGGTVFLDEIGELSAVAQAKLLRVLESGTITRLGGRTSLALDVRFIAATHRIAGGWNADPHIRTDLFFRLAVMRLHIPPLRERRIDVVKIAVHLLQRLADREGVPPPELSAGVIDPLIRYDWPGNVRELRNVLEVAFARNPRGPIGHADLPEGFLAAVDRAPAPPDGERERLLAALHQTNWNKSRAAECLHWSRMTLYRKLAKYRLARTPR